MVIEEKREIKKGSDIYDITLWLRNKLWDLAWPPNGIIKGPPKSISVTILIEVEDDNRKKV